MSDGLEWDRRSNYALTEFVLFSLASLILFLAITLSFIYSYLQLNYDVSFFSTLRPLFENVLPSVVAFTPTRRPGDEDDTDLGGKNKGKQPPKVNLVFIGHEERSPKARSIKRTLVRIWVHVYFILLCGLIILWAVSIFSDSVLYRKMSSCNDISVEDEDLSCFLLSDRDVPEGVQEIIDQEEGEKVPCLDVQQYIADNNLTFDLEVICYQYQLNPLAALGISYGAIKTVSFVIVSILSALFAFVNKLFRRRPRNLPGQNNDKDIGISLIVLSHVLSFILSLAGIAVFAIIVAIIHEITGLKNSGYDFLRGEKFYSYSVVVLVPITLIFLSFVPWWAFHPLVDHESSQWNIDFNDPDKMKLKRKMHRFVHRILLHQQFSTPLATLFDFFWANLPTADNQPSLESGNGVLQPIAGEQNRDRAEEENTDQAEPDNAEREEQL
jgi:hypothetical protein